MSFVEPEGSTRRHGKAVSYVTIAVHTQVKGAAKFRINVQITAAILARLGWKIGERITFLEGIDSDAGFLLFRKAENNPLFFSLGRINKDGSGRLQISVKHLQRHVLAAEETVLADDAAFQVFNQTLTVAFPFLRPKE